MLIALIAGVALIVICLKLVRVAVIDPRARLRRLLWFMIFFSCFVSTMVLANVFVNPTWASKPLIDWGQFLGAWGILFLVSLVLVYAARRESRNKANSR